MTDENKDNKDVNALKDALNKDIQEAQNKLVSEEVQKAIEAEKIKAVAEAKVQFEKDQLSKEQEAKIKQLEEQLKAKEKQSAEEIDKIKKKVDELTTSKAVYTQNDNPFNGPAKSPINIDAMSSDEYRKLEEKSRDLFFKERQAR